MTQPISSIAGSRVAMFLLGATLALGFTLSAYILSNAVVRMRHENTIKVKGIAETMVESDSAKWKAVYTVRNPVLAKGYAELESNQKLVQAFLAEANIPLEECTYSAVTLRTENKLDPQGNNTNELESYLFSQAVDIKSNDVQRIDIISKTITQLIKQDVEIASFAPQYVCSSVEKIKLDLLGKATQNAFDRAKALAENSQGKVGALSSASQGVFQITPVDSTEVTDYGSYDTTTIKKNVKAVVTLEFQIEK
jgi:hypothetical protein